MQDAPITVYRCFGGSPSLSGQPLGLALVPLPVPAPVTAGLGMSAFLGNVGEDRAIGPAAGVFPVRGFVGVVRQVQIAELVRLAVLHPAEAAEIRLSQIVGDPGLAPVLLAMIHAASVELSM